jgi:hypothetical protein
VTFDGHVVSFNDHCFCSHENIVRFVRIAESHANRLANKALLDQATDDLDCSSNNSENDDELVECQLLEGEHSLSSTLISEPVASEPIASESIRSTRLRKYPGCS